LCKTFNKRSTVDVFSAPMQWMLTIDLLTYLRNVVLRAYFRHCKFLYKILCSSGDENSCYGLLSYGNVQSDRWLPMSPRKCCMHLEDGCFRFLPNVGNHRDSMRCHHPKDHSRITPTSL
jgi:hypothetical protein